MKKRRSPIAKNLLNNSVSGMFSAIEIHNKPIMSYRYETVVLLILNAWELILKAYLYKYHKKIKLFHEDGTTKQFDNCLNITVEKIGKEFNPTVENLKVLYEYRNQVAHFFIEELNPVLFSLISKSIIFYSKFVQVHFKIDLTKDNNLILLPIGFKRPVSPIDYISNISVNTNASVELKEFLHTIVDASRRLNDEKIDETIFSDFRMSLTNVSRITNADLIAGIDNSRKNQLTVSTIKQTQNIIASKTGEKLVLTRDKILATGSIYYEELQDGIFDEINNIVDANKLLSKDKSKFMLGIQLYYRIYSERQHVNFNIDIFEMLAKTAMLDFYAPFMFWFIKLPSKIAANLLYEIFQQSKSPKILNLVKISVLLGEEASKILANAFEKKFKDQIQKPDYFYTLGELIKSKQTDPILKCLKSSSGKMLLSQTYSDFMNDNKLSKSTLSKECFDFFSGQADQKTALRELDYLAYADQIIGNAELLEEFKKYFNNNLC
ncbi:DUF3644 domain-containing protein [Chryseobacterium sp. ERMR1:04]|uniref:DUF3644 domain-containing protein n=1 Tax=Chryseobacterium sp. ERMR1:04 TaxID=1705393 RepID=UPI0006C84960|nr:DUF3644 domain-containing protein [Chryseobacterium sp. ERMR1:04]